MRFPGIPDPSTQADLFLDRYIQVMPGHSPDVWVSSGRRILHHPQPVHERFTMSTSPLIFDVHLDLSMNALEWNRDLRWSLEMIRRWENTMKDKVDRGINSVCFPEMRKGRIGLCVATQIGRYSPYFHRLPGWNSPEQAWAQTQGQLAWYRVMEEAGELVQQRIAELEKAALAQ